MHAGLHICGPGHTFMVQIIIVGVCARIHTFVVQLNKVGSSVRELAHYGLRQ